MLYYKNYKHSNKFLYNKIINIFINKGRKPVSEKNFKLFLKLFFKTSKKKACVLLKHCVKTNSILLNVKPLKKGTVVFKEIPYFVKRRVRIFYSIKSLKKQNTLVEKLSAHQKFLHVMFSVLNKSNSENSSKDNLIKKIIKKKSQAHFRWFF